MILSDKQLKITRDQLEKLKGALDGFHDASLDQLDWVQRAQYDGLLSQYEDLAEDVAVYEQLKSGSIQEIECNSLSELPIALIKARIASGITQSDLAAHLGMKAQQIQRYEASGYASANLNKLTDIANILGLVVSEKWQKDAAETNQIFSWSKILDVDWMRFPLREMRKRGWLHSDQAQVPVDAVESFFTQRAGENYVAALHRKKFRGSNAPDEYSLLAWQAYILGEATNLIEKGDLSDYQHNDNWLPELVRLSRFDDGPIHAQQFLAEQGIALVIEKHFDRTYLDGAAMMSDSGHPVIGLTLRYDRLDNFWFVLFHELGHVFLHLHDNQNFDFFDDTDYSDEKDSLEREADEFALNTLIPPDDWKMCFSRFKNNEEMVLKDAKRLGISPSIIAGRIRKEKSNYRILGDLVGQDKVRYLWSE